MSEKMTARLRQLLNRDGVIAAPCAFDAISARAVEKAGFELVATTGFGVHGTVLGVPDNGLVTFNEMLKICSNMSDAVEIPVMCDAEGGYGNAINTMRTIREFEKGGVAGLFIEDQRLPTNCPDIKETRLISVDEMCGKIKAAVAARTDPDFVIVARTDAPFDEAIERLNAYAEAGADMVKPIPRSKQELEAYPAKLKAPVHLGFIGGGKCNAGMTVWDAQKLGYKIVTFPWALLFSYTWAMEQVLKEIKEKGNDEGMLARMSTLDEYKELVRAARFKEWDQRFLVD